MKNDNDIKLNEDIIKIIVSRIYQRKEELKKESDKSNYSIGVIDGYSQTLDMIKNDLDSRGFDISDLNLSDEEIFN
ncbi:hypothetical protein SAMN05421767_13612 [Granulicatella balaenopterae]|uniref:Uncharacterized protein n=1 Tax=Granulicatella balaenopterae TaxID=137733 RepID=A0A1H9N808_9LACT|nr:hypothetical protein [Granulicatella balaenopterae]SER32064.1 hypothetical protein SAMN05421767_13612 [Granulicatella balaenopterae]